MLIKQNGCKEAWSGSFHSKEEADLWYEYQGKWWEKRGKKIILEEKEIK